MQLSHGVMSKHIVCCCSRATALCPCQRLKCKPVREATLPTLDVNVLICPMLYDNVDPVREHIQTEKIWEAVGKVGTLRGKG